MPHFIPTYDGRGIVALFDERDGLTCSPWVRSIPEAEDYLPRLRRDAWNSVSGIAANVWLEMSNDLARALGHAAELRAVAEVKQSRAA